MNDKKFDFDKSSAKDVVKKHSGILLDIGCGESKQSGFVGMDRRKLPGVDIVHDLEIFPWPLKDESCLTIIGSHIAEHILPQLTIDFFNELWRILKVDGQLALSMPYGYSQGFLQDPTHCNMFNEATFQYFDPAYELYTIYKPKPWDIATGFPVWQVTGLIEIMMKKMSLEEAEKISDKVKNV